MKIESMHSTGSLRRDRAYRVGGLMVTAVAVMFLSQPALHAADSAASKTPSVKLETIPGSTAKRVILTAKAAERLGIETGKVGMEAVARKQMVSGIVAPALDRSADRPAGPPSAGGGFGGFAPPSASDAVLPAAPSFGGLQQTAGGAAPQPGIAKNIVPLTGEAWVLVSLSRREWERLDKDKPARLFPLGARDQSAQEVMAKPSGLPPVEDVRRSMLSVFYVVPGKEHGLALNKRMRVELPMNGTEEKQKVIPYSAVYYDAKGLAWTYINPKPLVYERQRITVERIAGDVAVLSEGPEVGASVVTVGAALLYGSEIFGK